MDTLQNILLQALEKELTPEKQMTKRIILKFKKIGVLTDQSHNADIAVRIEQTLKNQVGADINTQLKSALNEVKSILNNPIDIDLENPQNIFTESDFEEFQNSLNQFINQMTQQTIEIVGESHLEAWKKQAPSQLQKQRESTDSFKRDLRNIWGNALDLLDILISTSRDVGAKFNQDYGLDGIKKNNMVFQALDRLHAWGCQVAQAILILLENGFADDAHARSRTLHELSVIAKFIFIHGNSTAERYLLHEGIDTFKAMTSYKEHCTTLGWEPLTEEEIKVTTEQRDNLVTRFGSDFKEDYGWASDVLKKKRPDFYDIEKAVGLDHLRPYFRMASHNVHASSKGAAYRLGLYDDEAKLLLDGPSSFGLGDPARRTAFSISLLTTTFLATETNFDYFAHNQAMKTLMQEVIEAFYQAEDDLEKLL
jgi:hypothetical protein